MDYRREVDELRRQVDELRRELLGTRDLVGELRRDLEECMRTVGDLEEREYERQEYGRSSVDSLSY